MSEALQTVKGSGLFFKVRTLEFVMSDAGATYVMTTADQYASMNIFRAFFRCTVLGSNSANTASLKFGIRTDLTEFSAVCRLPASCPVGVYYFEPGTDKVLESDPAGDGSAMPEEMVGSHVQLAGGPTGYIEAIVGWSKFI